MTIFAKPISLYEVGTSGDRVYLPGIDFHFEYYQGVEAVQYAIHQAHRKVGTWTYTPRTGVTELAFIEDFPKREWMVETNTDFHTETIRTTL